MGKTKSLSVALFVLLSLSACNNPNSARDQRLESKLRDIQKFVEAQTIKGSPDFSAECEYRPNYVAACFLVFEDIRVQTTTSKSKIIARTEGGEILVATFEEDDSFFRFPRPPEFNKVLDWKYEGEWSDTIAQKVSRLHTKLRIEGALTPKEKREKRDSEIAESLSNSFAPK